ncbi:bifunctional 2',3'-cyclic-nucleotide 2'-phosphodiesterase/3'-nucleotidase [Profundibacterium mesophilum]|uniref:23-cyclic nucleotide 2-phosphodiesterase3-nucleotidase n=1 Tax=Profundibacterium mesophilum KAUST100406-0324 TaxID=1037889 RepID=A0A921NZW3_9RHOB|nr:bifunctional 2',3'-cyclic-nucleotide 2'-phosphodiesterase/3'-nucleotidase [Profundibacterium mesophilum]KAF0676613.1 putative 23-cyclic nucleotide 2-phosphodiesterase3-nucleotidase [Profundibacterium mesophilum KAUST100406-0324]
MGSIAAHSGISMSRRGFIGGAACGGGLAIVHPFTANAAAGQVHLRVMETTDLHMHIWPYDYYADRPDAAVGLARTATHVAAIRAEARNSLLLDNGDFLQGNPMGDYMAYDRGMLAGDRHPMITAFNTLGFDGATLGNHEFNYGLDFLLNSLAGAKFPLVLSNVVTERGASPLDDTTLLPPYVILDRVLLDGSGEGHPIRIGLIGFTPPQIMKWDRHHLEGRVTVRDIVDCARAYVPRMRAEGADIVIALSHSGIGAPEALEMMENASTALGAVPGIDAILAGHSHRVFPGPDYEGHAGVDVAGGTLQGTPAVMAGFWGSDLGVIDLLLERAGAGWRVAGHEVAIRPIAQRGGAGRAEALVPSDDRVLAVTQADHEATLDYVRRPVGRSDAPLHSYFALVADDPSVQIVNRAQKWYIEQMLEGTPYEDLPVLSAAAPFKAGGRGGPQYYTDVPAGDLAIRNIADLYLYPNTIRAVKVSGAQVREWLERAAGMFNQIAPGAVDQMLLDPDFPSYNFDVIDGLSYTIDLSQPSRYGRDGALLHPGAHRIVDLRHEGDRVKPDDGFVVATNNYRAAGGGDFPGADGDTIIFEGPDTNRDVIVRYIMERGTISPRADGNWRFAPMPGATVLFDSGPGAGAHAGAVPGMSISPAGQGPDGFDRFRIAL